MVRNEPACLCRAGIFPPQPALERGDGLARQSIAHPPIPPTSNSLVLEIAVSGLRKGDLEVLLEGYQLAIRGTYLEAQGTEERRYWSGGLPCKASHKA